MKLLLLAAALVGACAYPVDAVPCAIDGDCGSGNSCVGGQCHQGTRACPVLQAKYSSIDQNLFKVSCGTANSNLNCHSVIGSQTASGLDLTGDSWAALVNVRALDLLRDPDAGVVDPGFLVLPGNPDASFLVTKLKLKTAHDPRYGSGMPADNIGAIADCPSALDPIVQWIQNGAPRN